MFLNYTEKKKLPETYIQPVLECARMNFEGVVSTVKDGVTVVTQSTWLLFAIMITLHKTGLMTAFGVQSSVRRILFVVFLFGDVSGTLLGFVRSVTSSFLFVLLCVLISRLLQRVDQLQEHLNITDSVR